MLQTHFKAIQPFVLLRIIDFLTRTFLNEEHTFRNRDANERSVERCHFSVTIDEVGNVPDHKGSEHSANVGAQHIAHRLHRVD